MRRTVGFESAISSKRSAVVLAAVLTLATTVTVHAADIFQAGCKSTCGNGAACLRVAKRVFSECSGTATSDPCLATYAATRTACKAAVVRCRDDCRTCAAATADQLGGCLSAADPLGCGRNTADTFFHCLRDGDSTSCAANGIGIPAEIAQSPFPVTEAEMLAIEASGGLVAPASVYERIAGDLAVIRAGNAEIHGIEARPSWVPEDLILIFDDEGKAAVAAGTYTAWDCLNARYGMTAITQHSFFVVLRFAHRFNAPVLAAVYGMLPHVTSVSADGAFGDGNDVCVAIDGDRYHYVFDAGSGDCLSGCIDHTYWGFTTSGPSGAVTHLGTWSRGEGDRPPWLTALGACTAWL